MLQSLAARNPIHSNASEMKQAGQETLKTMRGESTGANGIVQIIELYSVDRNMNLEYESLIRSKYSACDSRIVD